MGLGQNKLEFDNLISTLVQPKSPVEWNLALNNPYSPFYQEMDRLLKERKMEENLIFDALLDLWDALARQDQKSREDFIRNQIAASILVEAKLQESTRQTSPKVLEELENKTLGDLRKMAKEIPILLVALETERKAIKSGIEQSEQIISNADHNTLQLDQSILNSIRDQVINNQIDVRHPDGQIMSRRKFEEWIERPAANPAIDESTPAKVVNLSDMIVQLYKNDPSILAQDIFDDQLAARKKKMADEFLKYAELAYDPILGYTDNKLMKDFRRTNNLLEKIWRDANENRIEELGGYIKELRICVPKYDQQKKRLAETEREIRRLGDLTNNVEELIKGHERKVSRKQER